MKMKWYATALLASLVSVSAQAQSDVHKAKIRQTPEDRTARKLDRETQLAAMSPAERKAFKQAHQEQRQARLNAMTPEQRTKAEQRRRIRKESKRVDK